MIFISYRREDAKEVVTHLHRRLAERYGTDRVFVDYNDIPPGQRWPDVLRQQLRASRVLLAVVGHRWGEARIPAGKNKGRLRLDDPGDWVREEICSAIRRGEEMLLVVVTVDDATLPETEWGCELDQLSSIQRQRLRNQKDFDRDFADLCDWLDKQVPDLGRILVPSLNDGVLRQQLLADFRALATIHLPLIDQHGRPVVAPLDSLRIDLPLIVSHEHSPKGSKTLDWLGMDVSAIHEQLRGTHTNALLVDRATRHEDIVRDTDLGQRLAPGCREVVVGDPGCGKSTLLQWVAYHHSNPQPAVAPAHDWLPLLILCRDLAGQPVPSQLADVLRLHFKTRQFSDAATQLLVPYVEELLAQGRILLLIDGLDEIPEVAQRVRFCRLLTAVADRFPDAPMVITSRVVGFQAVKDELAASFDHLLVAPLDRAAKRAFVERWARLVGWGSEEAEVLAREVCYVRAVAKLTENVFLLALVAQIRLLDMRLPGRRVDVYRRAVQLMLDRSRPLGGPPLTVNEVMPHLEYLAYSMRREGVQRRNEADAVAVFRELRRLETDERALHVRPPEELLHACIESLGLLNVAGTETDRRGYERHVIQFFHQSFQEWFAGQAILHGRGTITPSGAVERLRDLLQTIEVREREFSLFDRCSVREPVLADYWQEAVRMGIAEMTPEEADGAMLMLLPDAGTPPYEARARAVFALQCLADEPKVGAATVAAVLEAVVDNLRNDDGNSSKLNTAMDEALAAVYATPFGERLEDRLVEAFIEGRGERRFRAGATAALLLSDVLNETNADTVIRDASQGFASGVRAKRVRAALELMSRCYTTTEANNGPVHFLSNNQQARLRGLLLDTLGGDEAVDAASLWALVWMTGARWRSEEALTSCMTLTTADARRLEEYLRQPDLDANLYGFGCLALTREEGVRPIFAQRDWIYQLAVIADGAQPRLRVG